VTAIRLFYPETVQAEALPDWMRRVARERLDRGARRHFSQVSRPELLADILTPERCSA
jgi:hypothetical protein